MRPRTAASLACRIIAIWLGIQAVMQAVSVLIFSSGRLAGTGQFWAINGTMAVVAWFLWIIAPDLGHAMARGAPDETAAPRSTANIHAAAFSVVGVILLVEAIPALVGIGVSAGASGLGPFGPLSLPGGDFGFFDRPAAVTANVIKIAIGVLLMMGSGDLARALARRYPEPEQPPAPGDQS